MDNPQQHQAGPAGDEAVRHPEGCAGRLCDYRLRHAGGWNGHRLALGLVAYLLQAVVLWRFGGVYRAVV